MTLEELFVAGALKGERRYAVPAGAVVDVTVWVAGVPKKVPVKLQHDAVVIEATTP